MDIHMEQQTFKRYIIISNVSFLNVTLFEQVTRQLFEPLVMQLIHWFTNNKKFESQDTVTVLEAIMVIIWLSICII